jgi:WD40 repeat protein/serine/threonine protein kinase
MDTLLALPNGTELAGDYRIERVLGAGGFGITYLAEETPLHRAVAIKEYFPSDFASREGTTLVRSKSRSLDEDYQWGLERFIEEAQALARFDHANIVRVYRYFRANNTGYMVLQHEPGRSFKGWLDNLGRPPFQDEMDRIVSPLLDALESIHDRDFLHRDIAPDNIIIRPDGSPVLIDFGSARREIARHAHTVSVLVKPGYSPFEQYAETGKQQGPWTDIYALAATLYHGITGRRPHDAPTRMTHDDVVPASQLAAGRFRAPFLAAIDHGLMLSVDARPATIGQWRSELLGADMAPSSAWAGSAGTGTWAPTRKIDDAEPQVLPQWHQRRQDPSTAQPMAEQPLPQPVVKVKTGPKAKAKVPPKPKVAKAKPAAVKNDSAEAPRRAMQQRMGLDVAPTPVANPLPRRSLMALLSDVGANMRASLPSGGAKAKIAPAAAAIPAAAAAEPSIWSSPAQLAPADQAPKPAIAEVKTIRAKRTQSWWMPLRGPAVRVLVVVGLVTAMVYGERMLRTEATPRTEVIATRTDLTLARSLRGHNTSVAALTFAADGRTLTSVGSDGLIRVWDPATGEMQRAIVGTADTTSIDVSQGVIAAGGGDGRVRLFALASGDELRSFDARSGAVSAVVFGGSANQLFEAGQDGRIRSFDQRGNARGVIGEHPQSVLALAYAVGPRLLVSGSADHLVKLWDERRRKLVRSYDGHTENVDAVAIVADGSVLASGSNDFSIVVWDGRSDRALARLTGHSGRVVALAFSPRSQMLASASEDGTVKLWDWSKGQLLHTYEGHINAVRALAFLPDGSMLASAGDDMAIRLWNVSVAGYR